MPISRQYKIIFLHNPKTGGTAIEKLFDITAGPENLFTPNYPANQIVLQHLPYKKLQKIIPEDIFSTYFKFTIVRNPWDRLVSDYHWKNRGCDTFEEFIDYMDDIYTEYTFEAIEQCPEVAKNYLGHFLPQYSYCGPDVTVYRFENFAADVAALLQKYNISKPVPRENSTHHKHYSHYYDTRTRTIVEKIYARDISLFGYTFEQK